MTCPHCRRRFDALAAMGEVVPIAPVICESCGNLSMFVHGEIIKPTEEQLATLKASPCWPHIAMLQRTIRARRSALLN